MLVYQSIVEICLNVVPANQKTKFFSFRDHISIISHRAWQVAWPDMCNGARITATCRPRKRFTVGRIHTIIHLL